MVKLDQLISHLENLRDVWNCGDIEVTVPVDDDGEICFMSILKLGDINIADFPQEDGSSTRLCYIDFDQFMVPDEDAKVTKNQPT